MAFVDVDGARLEVERIDVGRAAASPVVMLHEGLGSVAMWKDFPHRVAHAVNRDVVVYSRAGYGRSSPAKLPYAVRYMHDEALAVLPRLLDACGIGRPILLGHSDGGSIALIHAAAANRPVAGLALMAPHVICEDLSVASIAEARRAYEEGDLKRKLARWHDHVDCAFYGWNGAWLDPGFRSWDLRGFLPNIHVPAQIIQGEADQYGTIAQVRAIEAGCAGIVETVMLPGVGHSPYREASDATLAVLASFLARSLHQM